MPKRDQIPPAIATQRQPSVRLALGIILALVAFAANSLLTRQALDGELIAPETFTLIRLTSGAAVLLLISWRSVAQINWRRVNWKQPRAWAGGGSLLVYALGFTFAYEGLGAGLGALILFGIVQLTMIGFGLYWGEAFGWRQGLASLLALMGLVILLGGGLGTAGTAGTAGTGGGQIDTGFLWATALMALAGVAWGIQTALGKGSDAPKLNMARNFTIAAALSLPILLVPSLGDLHRLQGAGVALALGSGILASALGYVLWYWVLPQITTQFAGLSQLSVPLITAVAGIFLLHEPVGLRFLIAAVLILGGLLLVVLKKT